MRIKSLIILTLVPFLLFSKAANLTPDDVTQKLREIMRSHVSYKDVDQTVMKRLLQNYLESLDPMKTYFLGEEIERWTDPSEDELDQIIEAFKSHDFQTFIAIHAQLIDAIERRNRLDEIVKQTTLPENVDYKQFKDMNWAKDEAELLERLIKIKGLQVETAAKFSSDFKEKAQQRIEKRQRKFEEEIKTKDPEKKQAYINTHILKAGASALDAHTVYFTPDEATQFLINVQQRLFGIGAALRDDLNGFTVVSIVEGGPADQGKKLKEKDRIVAVDGEPVVGLEINEAVKMIRGKEGTEVVLGVIRKTDDEKEEQVEVTIKRGEVVLEEARYESSFEPYGDGVIAYLRLFSFYQDPEHSSADDLVRELNKIKAEHKVKGVILDLRDNTGGMLTQAVNVAGLFITKGVIVSIKDETGKVQHLRDLDGLEIWDGPLIILVSKASASASEIVSQTLQDYGRALIVGDEHTFGKGTFQTFTLNPDHTSEVNPKGEYKVTRGKYYTVSGKTPQLVGVKADIVVPSSLSEAEIGESQAKFPIENDEISPNFDDELTDIPFFQRERIRPLYQINLQKRETLYHPYLNALSDNSAKRIENNKNYQNFLKEIQKKEKNDEEPLKFGENDLQLTESYNIMKDLLIMLKEN